MTARDMLVAWLNDAYGMENALVQILEHQVKDAKDYPQVQAKLEEHLEQTRRHAQMVKDCVQTLGGKTSAVKSGMATMFGQIQARSTGAAQDELIKNALMDYAAESFEVASYTALVHAARALGEEQTAGVCQQILQEDDAMARWLHQSLPSLTQQTLQQATR
jgi:ferritin-like metal-binding protein YciE